MEWISFDKKTPPNAVDVLVLKTYFDAEFDEHGYHPDKSFWTKPIIQIDCFYSDNNWHHGGVVKYWMPLPELPKE